MHISQLAKLAAYGPISEDPKAPLSFSNNPISNTLRGDDKGLDWRWGAVGNVFNPINYAQSAYAPLVINPIKDKYSGAKIGDVGYTLANKLENFAKSKNIGVQTADPVIQFRGDYYAVPPDPTKLNSKPLIGLGTERYPGSIAHEIGHALAPKWVFNQKAVARRNVAARLGSSLGTLGALMSRDETDSRRSAIAGTAAFLPLLASELDAGIRGAKLLKRLGAKPGIGAFVGLPTYILGAATPFGAHYTKKLMGGFERKKTGSDVAMLARAGVNPALFKQAFSRENLSPQINRLASSPGYRSHSLLGIS